MLRVRWVERPCWVKSSISIFGHPGAALVEFPYRRPDDVRFVAISIDVVAEDALDFLKRYPVDYPVLLDSGGNIAREFAVNGMPAGFYIDREGNVRGVHVGFSRGEEQVVAAELHRLLAEKTAE
jgi:peroxiredoxin